LKTSLEKKTYKVPLIFGCAIGLCGAVPLVVAGHCTLGVVLAGFVAARPCNSSFE